MENDFFNDELPDASKAAEDIDGTDYLLKAQANRKKVQELSTR